MTPQDITVICHTQEGRHPWLGRTKIATFHHDGQRWDEVAVIGSRAVRRANAAWQEDMATGSKDWRSNARPRSKAAIFRGERLPSADIRLGPPREVTPERQAAAEEWRALARAPHANAARIAELRAIMDKGAERVSHTYTLTCSSCGLSARLREEQMVKALDIATAAGMASIPLSGLIA